MVNRQIPCRIKATETFHESLFSEFVIQSGHTQDRAKRGVLYCLQLFGSLKLRNSASLFPGAYDSGDIPSSAVLLPRLLPGFSLCLVLVLPFSRVCVHDSEQSVLPFFKNNYIWLHCASCGISVPWRWSESGPWQWITKNPNLHQATRELPSLSSLSLYLLRGILPHGLGSLCLTILLH